MNDIKKIQSFLSQYTPTKEQSIERLLQGKKVKKEMVMLFILGIEKKIESLLNLKNKLTKNDLAFIFNDDISEIENELKVRQEIESKYTEDIASLTCALKGCIHELYALDEVSPTVERKKIGKNPKSKKPEQIAAEEWAKDIWKNHPRTTQEQTAIQIKDALDLPQTIQTIIRWIRPFQPKNNPTNDHK